MKHSPGDMAPLTKKGTFSLIKKALKLSKFKQLPVIILGVMLGSINAPQAKSLNAGSVMNDMNSDQRVGYVSGVIEGLAYSRFVKGQVQNLL